MDDDHPEAPAFRRSPAGIGLCIALAVAGFSLLTEHPAHVFGVLPYLFILACPLMHLFMHRGPHRHGDHHARRSDDVPRRQ